VFLRENMNLGVIWCDLVYFGVIYALSLLDMLRGGRPRHFHSKTLDLWYKIEIWIIYAIKLKIHQFRRFLWPKQWISPRNQFFINFRQFYQFLCQYSIFYQFSSILSIFMTIIHFLSINPNSIRHKIETWPRLHIAIAIHTRLIIALTLINWTKHCTVPPLPNWNYALIDWLQLHPGTMNFMP